MRRKAIDDTVVVVLLSSVRRLFPPFLLSDFTSPRAVGDRALSEHCLSSYLRPPRSALLFAHLFMARSPRHLFTLFRVESGNIFRFKLRKARSSSIEADER